MLALLNRPEFPGIADQPIEECVSEEQQDQLGRCDSLPDNSDCSKTDGRRAPCPKRPPDSRSRL